MAPATGSASDALSASAIFQISTPPNVASAASALDGFLSCLLRLEVVRYSAPLGYAGASGFLVPFLFTLSYDGNLATDRAIDFYDVAQALEGFQRSLALTVHVMINGEVITQAPSLRGARILALPTHAGSWEFVAAIVGGLFALGQVPQNSVLGNLIASAYDYVISEILGFHVDVTKTLGQQYDELQKARLPISPQSQSKLDAVIEKCELSIKNMHRPIVWSKTATSGNIFSTTDEGTRRLAPTFDHETFEYIDVTREEEDLTKFVGRVSSYNINTFKGRIFVKNEGRPIPFRLGARLRMAESYH
jgi:hypothetical protein